MDKKRKTTSQPDRDREAAIKEVEAQHGSTGVRLGPPKLALLCVRELHRQGHQCAAGETDPTEVVAKMMALVADDTDDPSIDVKSAAD